MNQVWRSSVTLEPRLSQFCVNASLISVYVLEAINQRKNGLGVVLDNRNKDKTKGIVQQIVNHLLFVWRTEIRTSAHTMNEKKGKHKQGEKPEMQIGLIQFWEIPHPDQSIFVVEKSLTKDRRCRLVNRHHVDFFLQCKIKSNRNRIRNNAKLLWNERNSIGE